MSARARIRRRLAAQAGMTLAEMLVSLVVGTIVILAAYTVLDTAFAGSAKVAAREDAIQRGRLAMEKITRQLRSQVCWQGAPPMVTAQDDSVEFYVDLTSAGGDSPGRHVISFDKTAGTITETDYAATGSTPLRSAHLLDNVAAVNDSSGNATPVFSYYPFGADPATLPTTPLSTPLSGPDLQRAVRIAIRFVVRPANAKTDAQATTLEDDVYVRSADPMDPADGPRCQ